MHLTELPLTQHSTGTRTDQTNSSELGLLSARRREPPTNTGGERPARRWRPGSSRLAPMRGIHRLSVTCTRLPALWEFSRYKSIVVGFCVDKAFEACRNPVCALLRKVPLRLIAVPGGTDPIVAST